MFGLKSNQTNLGIRCIATFQLLGINARSMLLNYQRKILANLRLPPCCVLLNIYKQQGWLDFSVLTSCHVMANLKIALKQNEKQKRSLIEIGWTRFNARSNHRQRP